MKQYKVTVERHPDGYVAYPLGIRGVVVGEGETYEEALADVKSAIQFHVESFGEDMLDMVAHGCTTDVERVRDCMGGHSFLHEVENLNLPARQILAHWLVGVFSWKCQLLTDEALDFICRRNVPK